MLLQIFQIYFHESDYVMLGSNMSTMTKDDAKITHKLTQYYL